MELTGGYPLDAEFRPDGEVVYVRAPVTSQTLLAAYADRYQGRGGTSDPAGDAASLRQIRVGEETLSWRSSLFSRATMEVSARRRRF
ncbi:MAG: hypothetical protein ACLTDR_13195 [Adlercreutzia equolifaciens]